MSELTADLRKQLGRVQHRVLPEDYLVVHLPLDAKPIPGEWYRPATTRFAAFIRDPESVTLIVARRKWVAMKNLFRESRISKTVRVITLLVPRLKDPEACLTVIARALAESGLGAAPLSSFHRNHILVPKENLPKAIRLLRGILGTG